MSEFTSLTIKLGSIARHIEELLAPGAHPFDHAAIESLLADPEVVEWMQEADKLALLPVKRPSEASTRPALVELDDETGPDPAELGVAVQLGVEASTTEET